MFDFEEIEQVDPELFPGDWVKVRSLGAQGVVTSYCGDDGRYKVYLTCRGEDFRTRDDLQKLGDRERLASVIRGLLAASVDKPQFVAEARRIHAECVNAPLFYQRMQYVTAPLGGIYASHQVTEEWLHRTAQIFAPEDEEIGRLWHRLGGLGELVRFCPANGQAPSPSFPSTGAESSVKQRWVVVTPCGGICSRLCALVSGRMLAADLDRQLLVDWRPCEQCGCSLEQLLQVEGAWFHLLSPALMRQESCLHWASRVASLWHEALAAAGGGEEEKCQAQLSDFNDCHKKAFRRRLAYLVDPSSAKWRELPRLQGFLFERLPDFLQVDCICARASGWFYPPRPCDEDDAVEERSSWLNALKLAPSVAQRLFQLPPGTVCVHAERCGGEAGVAGRSPDWLLVREMDERFAEMKQQDNGSGYFFAVVDDPALEEALRERYGERLFALPRRAAAPNTLEAAEDTLVQLVLLGQGEDILGTYGSALSGLAPLLHSKELLVLDTEAEGGYFRISNGWAMGTADREMLTEVGVGIVAKDPSESIGWHLCGSWDGWGSFTKFAAPVAERSVYLARVRVRQPPEVEEFYVVQDSSRTERYYPRLCCSQVMGPDGTEGAYWRVRVPTGCEWLEVSWEPSGGRCLSWRLLGAKDEELKEAPEPPLEKQQLEGPFFLVGSWDDWQSFIEMQPAKLDCKPVFYALVSLRQPVKTEEFQVALGQNWEQRFHPARGSNAILGPANPPSGCNWKVVPAVGSTLLGVYWDPEGARSLRCECLEYFGGPSSPIPPLGQFFLAGSWDNWTGFVHLRPEGTSNPHCRARIRAKQTPVAFQFQVVIDRDWQQRFWRNKKGTEILGPGNAEGLAWIANVPAGCRWIEVTWDPTGARSLQWSLVGEPSGTRQLHHIADASVRVAEYTRFAEEREAPVPQGPPSSLRAALGDVDLCIAHVYRYHCDGVDDFGWGCVYRSTQTIMEALGHDAPPLAEITCAMGTGDEWLRRPGAKCAWAEPHDVADYLQQHSSFCKSTRLLLVAGREPLEVQEGQREAVMFCKNGTEAKYEVLNKQGDILPESPEARQHARRVRELLVPHLLRARTPVLVDDKEAAFLVVGFRWSDDRGPEYRVLDPHYGQTYAHRNSRPFNPALGPNQFGGDEAKDQWVSAKWIEECRGMLNGYAPNPSWMMLFIN